MTPALSEIGPTPWLQREFHLGQPAGNIGFILERLRGLPARLEQLLAGLPETILEVRPQGKWSVKEQIGHLHDLDRLTQLRLDEILAGTPVMCSASFRLEGDYNDQPLAQLLATLADGRQALIRSLESLPAPELERTSRHPRLAVPFSAIDLAYFDAEHDDHHLFSMRTILKSLANH